MRFVRDRLVPPAPPPRRVGGPLAWMRKNLFAGPGNAVTTLLILGALVWIGPALARFLVLDAVWTGTSGDACRPEVIGRPVGACWGRWSTRPVSR
jgi:general L-amino acid transport system permease protein